MALREVPRPLTAAVTRLNFLKACETVARDPSTAVVNNVGVHMTDGEAVVAEALRHPGFCAVGGRDGMPRSCASVYAQAVTLMLGGSKSVAAASPLDVVVSTYRYFCFAMTPDAKRLVVVAPTRDTDLCEYSADDGALLRRVPLATVLEHRALEHSLRIASVTVGTDGCIYAMDVRNDVIHVLSAEYVVIDRLYRGCWHVLHCSKDEAQCIVNDAHLVSVASRYLITDVGLVTDCKAAVFSKWDRHVLSKWDRHVFSIPDGACQLCFLPSGVEFAVVSRSGSEVFVMTVLGERLRTIQLAFVTCALACSPFGELCALDMRTKCLRLVLVEAVDVVCALPALLPIRSNEAVITMVPDYGSICVAASCDRSVRVYNARQV